MWNCLFHAFSNGPTLQLTKMFECLKYNKNNNVDFNLLILYLGQMIFKPFNELPPLWNKTFNLSQTLKAGLYNNYKRQFV